MDGFEVIYSKYSPLVFRYLLSLGVDFLSAEELTAETFYRAYINFDKYKGQRKGNRYGRNRPSRRTDRLG